MSVTTEGTVKSDIADYEQVMHIYKLCNYMKVKQVILQ
jgi:hypothetical protein